jgi:glc operon protein GlcG
MHSIQQRGRAMPEPLSPVHSSLPLAAAALMVDEAIAARKREGLLPLAVAVLDAGGNLVAFKREDGSGVLRFDIAVGKAAAALGMGMSSRLIRDRMAARPAFQNALAAAAGGRFIPVPGGVLILDAAGAAIGAVGISGDASDKDEYCAIAAVRAAGYTTEPDTPHPDWRAAGL